MNITIKNLTLSYGKETALNNVSLELDGPAIYGLLGRNGAGKTSLLSIIASFREPTTGQISIDGQYPFENRAIMQHVLFLYESDDKDNANTLVELFRRYQLYRENFDLKRATSVSERFKLAHDTPLKKMSRGMQAAVRVVLGLASRCPVTIFDEIHLGMDAVAREIFYEELLKEQEEHPRLFIISTHLVSEMDYLFDEVIILHEGRVLLQDQTDRLLERSVHVFGRNEAVDRLLGGKKHLKKEQLGKMTSV